MSFYRDTTRKARKEHKCNVCHSIIKIGEEYHDKAGINYDSDFFTSKECKSCQSLIDEFLKEGNSDEGYCDEWIADWWRDVKCYDCKHYYPPCVYEANICTYPPHECDWNKQGKCRASDTCDDMTHYCRCEKYEPVKGKAGDTQDG